MTDLFHIAPQFATNPFSHILPSLDKNRITSSDLLTLEALDVAKRAQVPVGEVKKLQDALLIYLHCQLGFSHDTEDTKKLEVDKGKLKQTWKSISTLDDGLDSILGGGIPTGYLTEITGESGAGKTQTLLTLLLTAQLPAPLGLSRNSMYISTEAPLSTQRLSQLLKDHPYLSSLPTHSKPSLSRIHSIQTPDLESQDHILRYQLPVAIPRYNIGLVILDSVAANYRAEFDKDNTSTNGRDGPKTNPRSHGVAMAQRSAQLMQLGALLRDIAQKEDVAIVVANQVADRFERLPTPSANLSRNTSYNSQGSTRTISAGPPPTTIPSNAKEGTSTPPIRTSTPVALATLDPMALDHQQRWFTGWGEDAPSPWTTSAHTPSPKTPSLGLVWTNQLACRIALIKEPVYSRPKTKLLDLHAEPQDTGDRGTEMVKWKRWMKVVFAPWTEPTAGRGLEFEITTAGLRSRLGDDGAEEKTVDRNAKPQQ